MRRDIEIESTDRTWRHLSALANREFVKGNLHVSLKIYLNALAQSETVAKQSVLRDLEVDQIDQVIAMRLISGLNLAENYKALSDDENMLAVLHEAQCWISCLLNANDLSESVKRACCCHQKQLTIETKRMLKESGLADQSLVVFSGQLQEFLALDVVNKSVH